MIKNFQMRNLVYATLLLLTLNCNAQKEDIMENLMKMPEFNEKYEFFDRDAFFFGKDQGREHKKKIVNKDTMDCYASSTIYEEYDKNKKLRVSFYKKDRILGYDYSTNPIIGIYKEFYQTGGIKMKGVYCWLGFKMGLWYHYDLDGNLIQIEDYEKGFECTTENIFAYCADNNISLERITDYNIIDFKTKQTKIRKITDAINKTFWYITYWDFKKSKRFIIQMDAKTGKVIQIVEGFPASMFMEEELN